MTIRILVLVAATLLCACGGGVPPEETPLPSGTGQVQEAMRPSKGRPSTLRVMLSPIFSPVPWAMFWSSEIKVGPR